MTATVNDQSITITDESLTVSESVGIYECDFTFDASWDTWNKTAVFEGAGATIEMIVVDNKAQIPWEVLKEAGWIKIGVYGTKGGEIKPTIWSDQIYVAAGTVPGSVEVTPTPSIYAQILDLANDAKDIAEDAQDTADDVASDWASVSATASTLSAGSPATVTFADNTFAFGIPKGAKGDTGATGATGATPAFSIGTVSTLETGQSATATITGTAAAPVLNLGLPKGNKGDNGDVANIADAYSTSATYAVGDYCIYSSQLYRCTTAITTAEAWTAAHWTAVQLGDDTSTLRSALINSSDELANQIDSEISVLATITTGSNILDLSTKVQGALDANGKPDATATSYSTSAFIPVNPVTTYYVDAFAGSTHNATPTRIALYDASFSLISIDATMVNTARSFTTTADTKYVRISGYTSRMSGSVGSYNLMITAGSAPTSYTAFAQTVVPKCITEELGANTNLTLSQNKSTELFNNINKLLSISALQTVTVEEEGNGFVTDTGGENTTSTSYRRSKPISFSAGDMIELSCAGRSQGDMCVLSVLWGGTVKYTTEIIPASASVLTHYYFVKTDCQIVFSWVYASGITVKKVSSGAFDVALKGTSYIDNPLGKIDFAPTMVACFDKITCIGDSLTQGVFNTTTGETQVVIERYSYPAFFKKHTGVDTINLGIGSTCASTQQNADSWFYKAGQDPYNYLVQSNVGDAVIIALGTNDVILYSGFLGDVDTDIDLSDRTQNAQNSVGGYANIIQWCREMNPKCEIFCVTISNVRNNLPASAVAQRTEANEKIRAIAEKLGCYVIDLERYAETTVNEQTKWIYDYRNGSHNNALGYEKRARQYATYIDWIILNNLDKFHNIQFIGTNYDYQS